MFAETRLLTSAQEFDLLGDGAGLGWAGGLLAYVRFYQGRFDEAEALAKAVRHGVGGTRRRVGAGDDGFAGLVDPALDHAIRRGRGAVTQGVDAFRQLGDRFGAVLAMGPRMRALVALGSVAGGRARHGGGPGDERIIR